jgi:hypothetical protein
MAALGFATSRPVARPFASRDHAAVESWRVRVVAELREGCG